MSFLNELQHDAAPEAAALTRVPKRQLLHPGHLKGRTAADPGARLPEFIILAPHLCSLGSPGQVTEPFSALVSSSAKWC